MVEPACVCRRRTTFSGQSRQSTQAVPESAASEVETTARVSARPFVGIGKRF
jgi:hypothetical protein